LKDRNRTGSYTGATLIYIGQMLFDPDLNAAAAVAP
jgi:hypothetical protein